LQGVKKIEKDRCKPKK